MATLGGQCWPRIVYNPFRETRAGGSESVKRPHWGEGTINVRVCCFSLSCVNGLVFLMEDWATTARKVSFLERQALIWDLARGGGSSKKNNHNKKRNILSAIMWIIWTVAFWNNLSQNMTF